MPRGRHWGYQYPIMLCNITQNAMGQPSGGGGGILPGPARGVPCQGDTLPGGYPAGGYPARGVPCWGVPCWGYPARGYPHRVPPTWGQDGGRQVGYHTWQGTPHPHQVRMGGYPVRTTEGVLTTQRAVCLLRSRRRTFLFSKLRNQALT